jgi:S1-C subfamily serine protease
MGGSDDLMIGETVVAIGNPYGFRHTVTTGVVSALDRTIETQQGTFMGFIQTDAAINPGNSGGPLLNINGEVVGINTAIYAKAQGIGFAIPINKAKRVVNELVNYGYVQPVWLGISGQNIDQRTASYFGLEDDQGLLVTEVYEDTPAHNIGLKPGDIVRSLAGNDIEDKEKFTQVLRNLTQDTEIEIVVWRNGERHVLKTQLEAMDTKEVLKLAYQRLGMMLEESSGAKGLVVSKVRPRSPADSLGLQPGDQVYKIAGQVTNTIDDFIQAFIRYRLQNNLLLLVVRDGQGYYVRLRI